MPFKFEGYAPEEQEGFKFEGYQEEPSRIQSIANAPVKGFTKGLGEAAQAYQAFQNPVFGALGLTGNVVPHEAGEEILNETLPTENKGTERLLERGGKVASYLAGPGKIASKVIRGGLATLGGQIAEELGLSKPVQSAVEVGALLSPTSLKGANKYVSSLYKQADILAGNSAIPARNLVQNVNAFIKNLSRGGPAASKNPAMAQAKEILKKVKQGNIEVKELTEFKKTINEARGALYKDQTLDKVGQKTAKRNLDEISKVVDGALNQYGARNPQWNKVYRSANEGHGAIANSQKVSRFISKTLKTYPGAIGTPLIHAIIGQTLGTGAAVKTAGAAVAGYGAVKGGELIARIIKSPLLRNYYKNAITASMKENASGFLSNIGKLDKALKEEENQSR